MWAERENGKRNGWSDSFSYLMKYFYYIRKPYSIGELMGLLGEVVPLRLSGKARR